MRYFLLAKWNLHDAVVSSELSGNLPAAFLVVKIKIYFYFFGGFNMEAFFEKMKLVWSKVYAVLKKVGHYLRVIGLWAFKLRKSFMALPVIILAIKLAIDNALRLPEQVGINLQSNGEFAQTISRNTAVFGPLLATALCLVLMACSRKTLFPWIISIFTLALPYLIYLSNIYTG